jgi:uncharacterized protein (TIGR03435 family)
MRALAFLAMLTAAAQTPDASLKFEVASIKPAPPPTGRGMRVTSNGGPGEDDPGLFTCENCTLSMLISEAFDLKDFQLSGPDWMRPMGMQSTRFMMSAKIPLGTTKAQFRVMLQNFLAERFKMTFHHEKKEVPGFQLVVAKSGPKFKEAKPTAPAPDDDAADQPGPPKTDANGFPVLPPGRGSRMTMMRGHGAMRADEETMAEFAEMLSNQLRQPVIDATGLSGKYGIAMYWVPGDPAPDDPGPSLFQALQEQLGLKLESKKGMVDVVVVDHIEKAPTEN